MDVLTEDFPLDIKISFKKLIDVYRANLNEENSLVVQRAKKVIEIADKYPQLIDGIAYEESFDYLPQIDNILEDVFSSILQDNEIKMACLPFNKTAFRATRRYNNIINAAGEGFEPEIKNFNDDHYYIMGCSIILGQHYGYAIDFRRPFYYDIPDANGIMKHYRILYNGDYIEIEKSPDAKTITQEDVNELLDNFHDIDLWKEKFPPKSYTFKGFVIANLFNVTADVSISDFKNTLLKYDKGDGDFIEGFQNVFRAIFNLNDLKIGFSSYNAEQKRLEKIPYKSVDSFVLGALNSQFCDTAMCTSSYKAVFTEKQFFSVSDVAKYNTLYPEETFYGNLLDQEIQSAIFAPITNGDEFLGLLELVSSKKHVLNSINANKLLDIMPYLVDEVLRSKARTEDELEIIIQNECTSIHPSVYWKFKQEAKRVMTAQAEEDSEVMFRDIVFKEVYPLFGQIDIKGSSDARNTAIQKDLLLQLNNARKILKNAIQSQPLPILEEYIFRLDSFVELVTEKLEVDSEQKILNFFSKDLRPLFTHLKEKDVDLKNKIDEYRNEVEDSMGLIYKYRKAYDDSVMLINKRLAAVLDEKQKEAQQMYPHFFERFKTDGVEHNMYIGEAITRKDSFNKIYLYNLRLWQLQVMCEMENEHYKLSQKLPHPLDVASMILVFNTSLSVRFRMDEKRFDVDGTYNARYEVVKKRVDKAHIKGTNERITQKGKIAIIYSQKQDEREYLKYIHFLQAKNYLGPNIEVVELDDLQAVTGLKAIRVDVLYTANKNGMGEQETYYTYDDLMKELEI